MIDLPVELTQSYNTITFAIDIVKLNTCYFLTTISTNIYCRTAHNLTQLTSANLCQAVNQAIKVYKDVNFNVTLIKADNEFKQLLTSTEHIQGMQVRI